MRAHELPLGEDFLDAVSVDVFADADGFVDFAQFTKVFTIIWPTPQGKNNA